MSLRPSPRAVVSAIKPLANAVVQHQRVQHAMNRQSLIVGLYDRIVLDDVHPRVTERLAKPHDDADRKHRESEVDVPFDNVQLALRQSEAGRLRDDGRAHLTTTFPDIV